MGISTGQLVRSIIDEKLETMHPSGEFVLVVGARNLSRLKTLLGELSQGVPRETSEVSDRNKVEVSGPRNAEGPTPTIRQLLNSASARRLLRCQARS